MAIKKSEIYSRLWSACDKLRGGVEPARYKNYILTLLFVKYVSDHFKFFGDECDIVVPEGGSFDDIIALKGKKNIGEGINVVIGKLAEENNLKGIIDVADFNSEELGTDKVAVDKLTELISIFEKPELDFSNNRAGGDDILGDAYEFLMRKFAQDSGKSKGQFYTPGEVSRIMAKVIGINNATSASMTVYDPACGSGSLLIRAADEAPCDISIYGQEIDLSTAGLARMNLVLHNKGAGEIVGGKSTIADPHYKNDNNPEFLKTFNFIVVNPPFSDKTWADGTMPDEYKRYDSAYLGIPPEKNGDFAWLLHVIKSMDPQNGKAAVILPHGVLFRGNAEETIRKNIIDRGYIKGIIGLPANLFYGTGIPACIIILDKEDADERKGIFMIDASEGFVKDGNKNRLREQDIHKIVTTYLNMDQSDPKYARFVSNEEIKKDNDYNLNIPRYIDNSEPEDLQDIDAHLNGGIPKRDIEDLSKYWDIYPSLCEELFSPLRKGYYKSLVPKDNIIEKISQNNEVQNYNSKVLSAFPKWAELAKNILEEIKNTSKPKEIIIQISEELLVCFDNLPLIDKYDVYEVLMEYWNDIMQDDIYIICKDGYEAGREFVYEYETKKQKKKGKSTEVKKIKSFDGKLIPKKLIIDKFFKEYLTKLDILQNNLNKINENIELMIEENYCEDGLFINLEKLNKTAVKARISVIRKNTLYKDELIALKDYLNLLDRKKQEEDTLKTVNNELTELIKEKYKNLTIEEIKELLIEDKWFKNIFYGIKQVNELILQYFSNRIVELIERYEIPLYDCIDEVNNYEAKVKSHLERMGFIC